MNNLALMPTPWGKPIESNEINDEIVHFATESHGGLLLANSLQESLPREVTNTFINGRQWAEEDIEAWIVFALTGVVPDHITGGLTEICDHAYMSVRTHERYAPCIPFVENVALVRFHMLRQTEIDRAHGHRNCQHCHKRHEDPDEWAECCVHHHAGSKQMGAVQQMQSRHSRLDCLRAWKDLEALYYRGIIQDGHKTPPTIW